MSMSTGGEGPSSQYDAPSVSGDINVTPLVDVMLVLLIIFMVVTPSLLQGFQATLPVGDNLLERPEEESRVVVGIDVDGTDAARARTSRSPRASDRDSAGVSWSPSRQSYFLGCYLVNEAATVTLRERNRAFALPIERVGPLRSMHSCHASKPWPGRRRI
jgi:hypothetical protein